MADLTIYLGNRNYASWSLRAWLALKATGAAFEEVVIPILVPVCTPTEPGIRAAGGNGFDDIWWLASVMPYASSIGTP